MVCNLNFDLIILELNKLLIEFKLLLTMDSMGQKLLS